MNKLILLSIFAFILTSCSFEKAVPLPEGCNATVYYAEEIKPFINAKCVTCHNSTPSYMNGGDFSTFELFSEKVKDGSVADHVFNKKDMAPVGYDQLTEKEKGLLKCWINEGAPNN